MMTSSNGNIFRITGPLCGEFTGPGEFPAQRPVTRSFYVFFDLRLNKRLNKHAWGWWFETLSRPFWRHRNVVKEIGSHKSDVTSASWCFTSPATGVFIHQLVWANSKENNKALYNWPFVRGIRWWPAMQKVFPWHDVIMGKVLSQISL